MAGFFSPESGVALGLLGAGLVGGDFSGGLLAANKYAAGINDRKRKGLLEDMQIENYRSEVEARRLKMEQDKKDQELFASIIARAQGGRPQAAAPGQLGSGSFGVVAPPAGQPSIPQAQQGGFVNNLTPDDVAILKMRGKDLTDIYKLATVPTSIPAGGYAFLPGQQPRFMPDPNKGLDFQNGRVSVLPGAADSQAQLTLAQELPKALVNSAGRVNLRDNPDGTKTPVPELSENQMLQGMFTQLFGGQQRPAQSGPTPQLAPQPLAPQGRPVVSPEQQRSADAEAVRMMRVELQNPNLPPADRAAIQREIARMEQASASPGFPAASSVRTPGMGYGKTTQQQIDEEAARIRATEQAKADVVPNSQRQQATLSADYLFNTIGKALSHKGRETATGLSGSLDPRNYIAGTDAKNFRVLMDQIQGSAFLKAYETLKGGGAITQIEGEKAERAIARLNTAQSDDEFKAALEEFQGIVKAGRDRLKFGGDLAPLPANPTPQNLQRGKAYPLPGGKVGVWDGMGFKVQ